MSSTDTYRICKALRRHLVRRCGQAVDWPTARVAAPQIADALLRYTERYLREAEAEFDSTL